MKHIANTLRSLYYWLRSVESRCDSRRLYRCANACEWINWSVIQPARRPFRKYEASK